MPCTLPRNAFICDSFLLAHPLPFHCPLPSPNGISLLPLTLVPLRLSPLTCYCRSPHLPPFPCPSPLPPAHKNALSPPPCAVISSHVLSNVHMRPFVLHPLLPLTWQSITPCPSSLSCPCAFVYRSASPLFDSTPISSPSPFVDPLPPLFLSSPSTPFPLSADFVILYLCPVPSASRGTGHIRAL